MAQVTKIILTASVTGVTGMMRISLPVEWPAIELGKALVDGMVTQGHFAELTYETASMETYRGPLEDEDELPDFNGDQGVKASDDGGGMPQGTRAIADRPQA